jgi:XTP/dITP diphosphohydrolase
MVPSEIVVATGNQGKLREIRDLLHGLPIKLKSLADFPDIVMPAEEGSTFAENARQKAMAVHEKIGGWVLADDSGLVVPCLDGEPGIRSARYAGDDADDRRNNLFLLDRLQNVAADRRRAYFMCGMVLVDADGNAFQFEGRCEGRIAFSLRGTEGFGYDPLFLLAPDFGTTMAEISLEQKQRISHRGDALRRLKDWLSKREKQDRKQ